MRLRAPMATSRCCDGPRLTEGRHLGPEPTLAALGSFSARKSRERRLTERYAQPDAKLGRFTSKATNRKVFTGKITVLFLTEDF